MVDIDVERAWLRQHGSRQRSEDEDTQMQRNAEWAARVARTCAYCFHETHTNEIGSASWSGMLGDPWVYESGSVTVLYCRTEGCPCGVPPCAQCGSRKRIPSAPGAVSLERCAQCGTEWQVSPIA